MPKPKLFIIPNEPAQSPQAPNNLPVEPSRLVGREREVEAVHLMLTEPHARLLTLVGPGGVGKTRLALQVAEELLGEVEEFEDGVCLVELASIVEADLVVPTIATTLQVREEPGIPLLSTLKTHLVGKRMLLVLDNFEQVISAGSDVAELLEACPDLRLLVTSRAAIGLRTEREFVVSPLAMPDVASLRRHNLSTTRLLHYGAIELFAQRASTLESDFELTEDNAEAVVEVCRRVDGLPLAIELVAAHARLLSPQSILARLRHPLRLLSGGPQDAPDRHRTMRDTIEWSYRLLNEGEQRLFRRLSVFMGGFEIRVAEGVCNEAGDIGVEADDAAAIEVLEGVEGLISKNLLRRLEQTEDGDRRLAMLETVREYAWERLVASGEAEDMQRRHADYYVWLAEYAKPGLEGHETIAWLDRLTRDHDNLRAALNWLLERGVVKEDGNEETEVEASSNQALQLLLALRDFWQRRTHSSEYARWIEKALMQVKREATPLYIRALIRISAITLNNGEYPKARTWAAQAVAMATVLGDKWQIAEAGHALALVELREGDYSAARSLLEESLTIYRELGEDSSIARTLINLGEVVRYQGDYRSAEGLNRESLTIFRTLGSQTGILVSIMNLGYTAHHLGNFREARATYLEAVTLAQKIDIPAYAANALIGLSGVILAEIDQSGVQDLRGVEQVTRLFGLVAGLLEKTGRGLDPPDQEEYDRNVAAARARLGEEAFTRAWEEGRAMTVDQALQLATHEEGARPGARGRTGKRGSSGLTSREYEVASLVTQGLSNEEIARTLVLSERTVEMHVSNALHKLGLPTRTQLAAWAVEQGLAPGLTQT